MRRSWFDQLLSRFYPPRPATPARRRPLARPQIESLENRLLLAYNVYFDINFVMHVDGSTAYNESATIDHSGNVTIVQGRAYPPARITC